MRIEKTQHTMPPTIITPSSIRTAKFFQSSTSRKEALSLYREILRTTKAFHWCDEQGIPWNIRLRQEARKEFEQSREEADPLIIARMLVTGRDCVQQIQAKFSEADRAAWSRIQDDSTRRGWWISLRLMTKMCNQLTVCGSMIRGVRQPLRSIKLSKEWHHSIASTILLK